MSPSRGELDDHQQILDVLYRYCDAVDRNNPVEECAEIWHPGALAHYEGTFDGTADEFMAWALKRRDTDTRMVHHIHNPQITVAEDRATSTCLVTAYVHGHGRNTTIFGRMQDSWSRRNGKWRIDERRYVQEFSTTSAI